MKTIIGILLILIGIALGVYVGLFVMFVGGIAQIVDGVNATPIDGGDIGWGIVRIMFASLTGMLTGLFLVILGMATIDKK